MRPFAHKPAALAVAALADTQVAAITLDQLPNGVDGTVARLREK